MQKSILGLKQESNLFFEIVDFGLCDQHSALPAFNELSDFLFIYFLKGSCELEALSKNILLSAGDFVICRPFEAKSLKTEGDAFEFYFATFSGRLVSDLISNMNLQTEHKYFLQPNAELTSLLEKILYEKVHKQTQSDIIMTSAFISVLAVISRQITDSPKKDKIKGYEKISPALDAINSDCTDNKGVEEYAKMCNLSSSYFTHLFTKIIGKSPMEYKQLRRMDIAQKLLITTGLSIKEISTIIGFRDPLYFGRCFKQTVGKTPSQFRQVSTKTNL